VGLRDVAGTPFDLRTPRLLGAVEIDHAFTGLAAGPDGCARAELRGPDGSGVAVEWPAADLPWVQVHTADRPGQPELHRAGLAVEPMTAPPDALASGQDVVRLRPGDRHAARWSLRRL
jgi:aldose 1-epimerase